MKEKYAELKAVTYLKPLLKITMDLLYFFKFCIRIRNRIWVGILNRIATKI